MSLESTLLGRVCSAARITRPQLAHLLQVSTGEVDAFERGEQPRLIADCARLLGLTVEEVFAPAETAPVAKLYRTLHGQPPALRALAEEGTALTVGGYVQDLRRVDHLENILGVKRPAIPEWASYRRIEEGSLAPHGAEELAREVREGLGLGLDPIDSVWQLAGERLGIRCAAVTPDELSPSIAGISWRDPSPMLVANLVGGASRWWGTRMTVAHELAHVLFDLPALGLVLSGSAQGCLYELFLAIEQRANAFAAALLVPPDAVRRLARGRQVVDLDLVKRISGRFQVSTLVACNVLCDALRLPYSNRQQLRHTVEDEGTPTTEHVDSIAPPSPRRLLAHAVEKAVTEQKLDAVTARTMLGLKMSDPLPFGEGKPLLGLRERIRGVVAQHLHRLRRTDLAPADEIRVLPDDAYEVPLVSAVPGGLPLGPLRLNADLVVVDVPE